MVRKARERSSTGIYHVMLRGLDKRNIFIEDVDRIEFIEYIKKAKKSGEFELYGYCLMDNHVHLLIKENEEIGKSIKRITVGYVGWHNRKYERIGHLFQNRYISETVETESYLLTVLRYIHQNPVKARIVNKAKNYEWSSYRHYYFYYQGQSSFVNSDLIEAYFKTYEEFSNFMNADNNDECLEYKVVERHNDDTLREIINREYDINELDEISIEKRNKIIKEIYSNKNTSIRQLSRVLGIGNTIIERALKGDE